MRHRTERKVTVDLFLANLAMYMAGELSEAPQPPPGDLGKLTSGLAAEDLALCALSPLLDSIFRGWDDGPESNIKSAEMLLRKKMGEHLRDRIGLEREIWLVGEDVVKRDISRGKSKWKFRRPDWTEEEFVKAGHWLHQCAMDLSYFSYDENGLPKIADAWQAEVDQIRQDLLRRDPVRLPHTKQPPDWTDWQATYEGRAPAVFIRNWHPESKKLFSAAFDAIREWGEMPEAMPLSETAEPLRHEVTPILEQHVRGVNTLQRVPLVIDQRILSLVKRFAGDMKGHEGKKRADHKRLVDYDVSIAKECSSPFWLTYNCDERGRIYPLQHFNYTREDHIRGMFKFANGKPLGLDGLEWLEINCANCEGSTKKKPWPERHNWVANHREKILKIAADPEGTFELWRKADKPFRYVAACIELVAALSVPTDEFITHLPIELDGTCNGIQHWALIMRDPHSAKLANLADSDRPDDVYSHIIERTKQKLLLDDDKRAAWWIDRFELLGQERTRTLLKTPAMTFTYGSTQYGMAEKVTEKYFEMSNQGWPKGAGWYLAGKLMEAAKEILPVPYKGMEYVRRLASHCADRNQPLRWTSPSDFPVCIHHQKPKMTRIRLVANGRPVEYQIADGYENGIIEVEAVNASAPNLVHSLDAAHLVKTVNAAVADGITDFLTVHDCYACLAPQVKQFNLINRERMGSMYNAYDALQHLHNLNYSGNDFPPPARGDFDPLQVEMAEYSTM